MALLLNFEDPHGTDALPTAYLAISRTDIDWVGERAVIHVTVWRDPAAHKEGKSPVAARAFSVAATGTPAVAPIIEQKDAVTGEILVRARAGIPAVPGFEELFNDGDVRARVYAWLKTMPQFAGAVDA